MAGHLQYYYTQVHVEKKQFFLFYVNYLDCFYIQKI